MAWKRVWDARVLDASLGSPLARLLAADGFDTSLGQVQEAAWVAFVEHIARVVGLEPGMSVFEVGCGAGAFLYPLQQRGCRIGGLDQSAPLIDYARSALPDASFDVADALDLDTETTVDVVVACGVFLYFPSLAYARAVIQRMSAKARRAVVLLDLPDTSTRSAALEQRQAAAGGRAAYIERYRGLEHLYYHREWIQRTLAECGLVDACVADQDLAHYRNAPFRFNAWAYKSTRSSATRA